MCTILSPLNAANNSLELRSLGQGSLVGTIFLGYFALLAAVNQRYLIDALY